MNIHGKMKCKGGHAAGEAMNTQDILYVCTFSHLHAGGPEVGPDVAPARSVHPVSCAALVSPSPCHWAACASF